VHEGGSYRQSQIETFREDYPHYNG